MARSRKYTIQHSQNFLENRKVVSHIVALASISLDDTVVEVGPGKGVITTSLAQRAGHVIAIEKDERLARELLQSGTLPENVTLYCADAISFPMPTTAYRVFANIPFRHTAAIVGKFTTGSAPPADAYLIVQREAAERFMIGHESTMRAQQLSPFFNVSIRYTFKRRDFSPAPDVDCVLMHIHRKENPELPAEVAEKYNQVVDVVYSAWQPTLEAAIRVAFPRLTARELLADRRIHTMRSARPSEIPSEIWVRLYNLISDRDDDRVWREIHQKHARNEANRRSLDRPTRTNKHGRQRPR